jgi:hypothetical protein
MRIDGAQRTMLGTIDFRAIEEESADPFLLEVYLQQLVGQPLLHFRFSYGDELSLHLGEPRAYATPKLQHRVKGSYVLGTRASSWYLTTATPPNVVLGLRETPSRTIGAVKPLAGEDLERLNLIAPGSKVVSAQVTPGFGISLGFSDGSVLRICPSPGDGEGALDDPVADWELFTPHERYVSVGPGERWSYLPSRHETVSAS